MKHNRNTQDHVYATHFLLGRVRPFALRTPAEFRISETRANGKVFRASQCANPRLSDRKLKKGEKILEAEENKVTASRHGAQSNQCIRVRTK